MTETKTHITRLEVPHGTVAERAARGRAARRVAPRSSHAEFSPSPARRSPVDVLVEQAATRVPELLPIRYGRMASSPFAFFRGAAAVMAMDLAATPTSGLTVQLCGDAHLLNFGNYNSPERRLMFDLNDFDETLPGPFEWDVKRFAASVVIACQDNGFTELDTLTVVRDSVQSYRTSMAGFAGDTNLAVWYSRLEVESLLTGLKREAAAVRDGSLKRVRRSTSKFAGRDNLQAFGRLTEIGPDGRPRFRSEPPLVVPIVELAGEAGEKWVQREAARIMDEYRQSLEDDRKLLVAQYTYTDLARKVVGVGSVGTRAWMTLLLGRDDHDPLILQFKEATPSVLEPYLGRSEYPQHGHRVVAGQRLMQATSDIFLGWYRGRGLDGADHDFYVRQLRDGKGSVDISLLGPAGMRIYGALCAWTLARAHARSGARIAIAAYLGKGRTFDDAITEFAVEYAAQNQRDHAELVKAIESGRVEAVTGV
ncbi:MAG: DUF2252 domain-containing protein [Candidatus Nanopelagicales bacterium]